MQRGRGRMVSWERRRAQQVQAGGKARTGKWGEARSMDVDEFKISCIDESMKV